MIKKLFVAISTISLMACSSGDWRSASREPAGIAPNPAIEQAPVIEVYAAMLLVGVAGLPCTRG